MLIQSVNIQKFLSVQRCSSTQVIQVKLATWERSWVRSVASLARKEARIRGNYRKVLIDSFGHGSKLGAGNQVTPKWDGKMVNFDSHPFLVQNFQRHSLCKQFLGKCQECQPKKNSEIHWISLNWVFLWHSQRPRPNWPNWPKPRPTIKADPTWTQVDSVHDSWLHLTWTGWTGQVCPWSLGPWHPKLVELKEQKCPTSTCYCPHGLWLVSPLHIQSARIAMQPPWVAQRPGMRKIWQKNGNSLRVRQAVKIFKQFSLRTSSFGMPASSNL